MSATYRTRDAVGSFIDVRQLKHLLLAGAGSLAIVGVLFSDSVDNLIGYLLVMSLTVLPTFLWLRLNAPGVPVFPVIAALHYPYFALPILRENFDRLDASSSEILRAGATASLFLAAATIAWWFIVRERIRYSTHTATDRASSAQVGRLILLGLGLGICFQVAVLEGGLDSASGLFGVIRAIALSAASVGCYLTGYARARQALSRQTWVIVLAAVSFLVIVAWSTFFLVGGMQFVLAVILGFSITSKRVPWKLLVPVVALLFILHAGKAEMRQKYWNGEVGYSTSISDLPDLFTEWFGDGIDAISTGQMQDDLFNRASLLNLLIYVQRLSPDYVPYLGGETYGLLPSYLMPRFIDPDRVSTQAGLTLLNIRYGLQTEETARYTTIGWGMIAEAYANFGYTGVFVIGLVFGLLTSAFSCWSTGAPPLALSTLLSVAALVVMTNIEADFGFLIVSLWQTLAATLIAFLPLKYLTSSGDKSIMRRELLSIPGE